jgi:hypothetical protein
VLSPRGWGLLGVRALSKTKLSDAEAKKILLETWPRRTDSLWPCPRGDGYWMRVQPPESATKAPRIHSPGAKLFATQPDGLWIYLWKREFCDVVAFEVCGSVQNLNDKRSRYIPSSHSLVVSLTSAWLAEPITVQSGGNRKRHDAFETFGKLPKRDIQVPIRHLRIMYALPDSKYDSWCLNHTPTGYEYFCPHSSLNSYSSQKMQSFLAQMSILNQFYKRPKGL